jgi:1-acyl-sn-glycerol-3-phosphate acyltransferase
MNLAYKIIFILLRPLGALLYPQRQTGRENIPDGPCILCANHSSVADPVLLAFAIGVTCPVHFMAKKELFRIPGLHAILKLVRAVSIDRNKNDIGAIRQSMRYLKQGEKLLIFPEGTRVQEDDAVAAKNGAVRLALKMDVPLVPVFLPRNKRLFRRVEIRFGAPYRIAGENHADYRTLSDELMDRIHALGQAAE